MRALFVAISDYPGGAEGLAISLAARVARCAGWDVEYRILTRQVAPSFSAARLPARVTVRHEPTRFPLLGLALLPLRLADRDYDLIFTTHVYTNALVSALRSARLLKARRLVTRESTTVFDRFRGPRRWLFQILYRLYGGQDLIIAQTSYMADHVRPRVPRRCRDLLRVVPNPVDVGAIAASAAAPLDTDAATATLTPWTIVVCGRLEEVKQPLLALDVLVEARRLTAQDLRMVFIGDGRLRSAVEAGITARGLDDKVALLGRRANPYAIMAACRYGLLTSSREGFPNVVLEMMACGLRKVVMTPCAGDLDALTGVTVTRGFTATELASALFDAIESGENHSEAYRALVAERSVERYLDAILGEDHRGR